MNPVFAMQDRVFIPIYKIYVLPLYKDLSVSAIKLAHYNGIRRLELLARFPGLDKNILQDLIQGERHPSMWAQAVLKLKGRYEINLLQIMTTSSKFPETREMTYDVKKTP